MLRMTGVCVCVRERERKRESESGERLIGVGDFVWAEVVERNKMYV